MSPAHPARKLQKRAQMLQDTAEATPHPVDDDADLEPEEPPWAGPGLAAG